jgi:hypothetical protein
MIRILTMAHARGVEDSEVQAALALAELSSGA